MDNSSKYRNTCPNVVYLPLGYLKQSKFVNIKEQGKAVISFIIKITKDKFITEKYFKEDS